MIDEGDLYFHPKWQRRFLSLLLRFLPRCFEGVPVQLVLTSNSPFVVSDLPRSCITFVEGPGPGRASVRVLGQSQVMAKGATFAANIHLLLADSFFMGHALAGEFSTRKLQELISFLSSSASRKGGQHSCEESRWLDEGTADSLIEQIGEPVLRNKLREMYNEQFLGNAEHNSLEKRIRRAEADLDDLRSRHRNMVERRDDQD